MSNVTFVAEKDELSLLRLEGKDGPVFFVIRGLATHHGSDKDMQAAASYLYEEHSCPTNWLRDVVAVIEGGDDDPHGFLEHVRTVQVPCKAHEAAGFDLKALFPEAFTAGEA